MIKKVPLIDLTIDPANNYFVNAIAILKNPAIESNFFAFNDVSKATNQKFADEKMELLGYAMIPDVPIYRYDENMGEYGVRLSAETIREIAQTFAKKGLSHSLNIDHNPSISAGSYVYQSYLVDIEKGINAPKGLESIDGAWVIGVKVDDPNVWADIKAGKQAGFSVEGDFVLTKTNETVEFNFNKEDSTLISSISELSKYLDELIVKHQL